MNNSSANQFAWMVEPQAVVNNASWSSNIIDTAAVGLEGTSKVVVAVRIGATDVALTALKLRESNDSGMSGATDITGAIYGTSTNDAGITSTLPTAGSDNKTYLFTVDWQGGRKRYFDLVATAGGTTGTTGCFLTAVALLGRTGQTPYEAITMGAAENLNA